jgi:hypothetical protein
MDNSENTLSIGASAEGSACSAELVTISRAELEALLARADAPSPIDEAKPSRTIGITDTPTSYLPEATETDGQDHTAHFADEMSERNRRLTELERVCKLAVCERDLATVLAGRSLVLGAASQLIKLWRDDFGQGWSNRRSGSFPAPEYTRVFALLPAIVPRWGRRSECEPATGRGGQFQGAEEFR